jgi:hypothetical protein
MNGVGARPAESLTLAAALVTLIVAIFGITDPQVYQALIVVIGAVPAGVTFLVQLMRKPSGGG